jgi:hypothetical protein
MEPTTPTNTTLAEKARDIGLKMFWTGAVVAITLLEHELITGEWDDGYWWSPIALLGTQAVVSYVRQLAGKYVPPPAEAVKSSSNRGINPH